jgi:ribonuclease HI
VSVVIHIDGAARGNPGPAAFAYVITRDGRPPIEEKACLGSTTNNIAEYTALVRALQRAAELGARRLAVLSDSELLVKQMNGQYRVKNEHLRVLYDQAKQLTSQFDLVTIRHVPRSQNSHADRLCNEALDAGSPAGRGSHSQPRQASPTARQPRFEAVKEEALLCLQAAASCWAQGNLKALRVEDVWNQLWSILEEHKVLQSSKKK